MDVNVWMRQCHYELGNDAVAKIPVISEKILIIFAICTLMALRRFALETQQVVLLAQLSFMNPATGRCFVALKHGNLQLQYTL